jgi:glycerophosphoryl diester phosphodiesterase
MPADTYRWNVDAPLVIAHRGASSIAPENTIPAFKTALAEGADAIELDIKLTKDGVLVVHHDQTLDRTTNGSGRVSDWAWKELRKLDAGKHHSEKFSDVRVPSLHEVFENLGDQLLYNLELTEYRRPITDIAAKTTHLVRKYHLQDNVLFSSFSPVDLFRLAQLVDKSRIALLINAGEPGFIRILAKALVPHMTYHPADKLVDKCVIESTHENGNRINVWTVNAPDRMRNLFSWGVDGIITDVPALAVRARDDLELNK